MRFLPQLGRALEDGANPEKQNEERNQQTRGMCEIGAIQMLHRIQRTLIPVGNEGESCIIPKKAELYYISSKCHIKTHPAGDNISNVYLSHIAGKPTNFILKYLDLHVPNDFSCHSTVFVW